MQKVGNFWKITILRSPETLVFLVVYWSFFNVPQPFSTCPALFTKISEISLFLAFRVPKSDFLAPNRSFGSPAQNPL